METNNIPTVCTMCNCNVAIEMIDGSIIKVPMEARFSPDGFTISESLYRYDEISVIYGLEPVRMFYAISNTYRFTEAAIDVESYTNYLKDNGIL